MVPTMFVAATVETLLHHRSVSKDASVVGAARELISALDPIGEPFDVPWKLFQSLDVLDEFVPDDLTDRLLNPGAKPPRNHLEASVVALAQEAGVRLEPLTKLDMQYLQHGTRKLTETDGWGRQSPYPWDTLAAIDLEPWRFFALASTA